MFYLVLACLGIYFGYVDVESAQSGMSVAAEVQVAIGTEGRKHLVARSVDRFAKVLYSSQSGSRKSDTPDVESAHSSRHVGHEV